MSDWKFRLGAYPIDWLLEEVNPSIRYWALKNLLDKDENDPKVTEAKRKIMGSKEVQIVFSKINVNGEPFWSKSIR